MSIDNLIVSTCNQSFSKYLHSELIIGKLAHSELKDAKNKGDEVDIIMPPRVTVFGYTGGDLPEAEDTDTTIVKIKFDKGYAVHFTVKEVKKVQINNAPDLKQKVDLAKEYGTDATQQASAIIDKAYGNLYTRAGHYLSENDGSAIDIDGEIAVDIMSYMQTKFTRNDTEHNNWTDGEMLAIVPPEFQRFLTKSKYWQFTESGHKKLGKGYVGHLFGWDILCSNNIAQPEKDVYMPLFGHANKTLAGGVAKTMSLMSYVPEKNFDTAFKGYGYFGVGAPRADMFGTVKVSCPLKLDKLNTSTGDNNG